MDAIGDPFSDTGLLRYFNSQHKSHKEFRAEDPEYNYLSTALLSLFLGLGTTWLIFVFRDFKFTAYWYSQGIRNNIYNFAVTLSVLVWTIVTHLGFPEVQVEELNVPSTFEPSYQCCDASCTTSFPDDCPDQAERWGVRLWFADLGDLNGRGTPLVAAGPGILAFLLTFLDNGITWHLINNPANKLE